MKLSLWLVFSSVALNFTLFAVYVADDRSDFVQGIAIKKAFEPASTSGRNDTAEDRGRIRGATRRELPSDISGNAWARLNASDPHALAARLNAAGFSPRVVRAIVSTRIDEMFKKRRAALVPQIAEKPFWDTGPGGFSYGYDPKLYSALRELGREQNRLLKEVLGENPEANADSITESQRRRFGPLPADKIEALQRIDEDYNELQYEVNSMSRGILLPEDREKLAILEQEKRADLAHVLSPAELDDYLVRTSPTTGRLRRALGMLNATEPEFRAIYAAQSAYDEKFSYEARGNAYSPELEKEREAAQKQTYAQVREALGEERYADYLRVSDREFQQLARIAQQANVPELSAVQIYNLRADVAIESGRIATNNTLSSEEKKAALKALADNTRAQISATLGPEAGESYIKVASRWLSGLDRGASVTFSETGAIRTRSIPNRTRSTLEPAGNVAAPTAPPTK